METVVEKCRKKRLEAIKTPKADAFLKHVVDQCFEEAEKRKEFCFSHSERLDQLQLC